jgi:hypothetical protein
MSHATTRYISITLAALAVTSQLAFSHGRTVNDAMQQKGKSGAMPLISTSAPEVTPKCMPRTLCNRARVAPVTASTTP